MYCLHFPFPRLDYLKTFKGTSRQANIFDHIPHIPWLTYFFNRIFFKQQDRMIV